MVNFLSVILVLLMFILGIIYCFWGYRYLKVIIILIALFAGLYYISGWLSSAFPQLGNWIWLISLAGGAILALLCFFFIKFAIFLAGGIVGLLIFNIVKAVNPAYFAGLEPVYSFLIGAAFFIILGLITLAARRHLLIIFTALFGAYSLVYSAGILIGLFFHAEVISQASIATATTVFAPISVFAGRQWLLIVLVALFTVLGIISQYKVTAPRAKRDTRMGRRSGI